MPRDRSGPTSTVRVPGCAVLSADESWNDWASQRLPWSLRGAVQRPALEPFDMLDGEWKCHAAARPPARAWRQRPQ